MEGAPHDTGPSKSQAAYADITAIASVAIQGVVAICGELVGRGAFGTDELSRISDFMLASLERSGASGQLQAHLQEALSHQFSALVRDAPGRGS